MCSGCSRTASSATTSFPIPSGLEPLLGGFGNRLLTEFPEPVDVTRQAQQAVAEAPEDALVDKAEQERFSLQRQRNALQTQLRHAVEAEDFESAARLRDQLKALPQQ